jgi:hypothetical protein
MAIKDEDPTAQTTTNLHTDVPESVHQLLGLPGYFVGKEILCAFAGEFHSYPLFVLHSQMRQRPGVQPRQLSWKWYEIIRR